VRSYKSIQAADETAPLVRDHRDLPAPLDVLGARLRAARIRFRVRTSQTGYWIELVNLSGDYSRARAEAIWLGTRAEGSGRA